jgi:hypothetical protein
VRVREGHATLAWVTVAEAGPLPRAVRAERGATVELHRVRSDW